MTSLLRTTLWLWGALLVAVLSVHASAQTSQPAVAQSESAPLAKARITLDCRLLDLTTQLGRRHQGDPNQLKPEVVPLADAMVQVQVRTLDGESELVPGKTDSSGRLTVDLGERYLGTAVTVLALAGSGRFLSRSIPLAEAMPTEIPCFKASSDPQSLRQSHFTVVTRVGDDERPYVRVRQIIQIRNLSLDVYTGPPGEPTLIFPCPEGAEMIELSVNREAIPIAKREIFEGLGGGIPIQTLIYPAGSQTVPVIGAYEMPLEKGQTLDLSFMPQFQSDDFKLAIEVGKFFYGWPEDQTLPLVFGQRLQASAQFPHVELWSARGRLPARATLPLQVIYGSAPVHSRTKATLVFLVLGILLAVGLGLVFARSKKRGGASNTRDMERQLDQRLALGEIDLDTYKRQRAEFSPLDSGATGGRVPSGAPASSAPSYQPDAATATATATAKPPAPPLPSMPSTASVLAELDDMLRRGEMSNQDLRCLVEIVRSQVAGEQRG